MCRPQRQRMQSRTDLHVRQVVMTRLLHVRQMQLLRDLAQGLSQQHKVDPGQLALFLFRHIRRQDVIQACRYIRSKCQGGQTHRVKPSPLLLTGSQGHLRHLTLRCPGACCLGLHLHGEKHTARCWQNPEKTRGPGLPAQPLCITLRGSPRLKPHELSTEPLRPTPSNPQNSTRSCSKDQAACSRDFYKAMGSMPHTREELSTHFQLTSQTLGRALKSLRLLGCAPLGADRVPGTVRVQGTHR